MVNVLEYQLALALALSSDHTCQCDVYCLLAAQY